LVKSTFTPSVDRELMLDDANPGRVVLIRITNSSTTKVIRIRDFNSVLLATLGTGGGPGTAPTWIQIATDSAGNGFSLAWDNGGPWTISV